MKLTSTMAIRVSLYLTAITQNVKTVKTKFKYPQYPQQVFLIFEMSNEHFRVDKIDRSGDLSVTIGYRYPCFIDDYGLFVSILYQCPWFIRGYDFSVSMIYVVMVYWFPWFISSNYTSVSIIDVTNVLTVTIIIDIHGLSIAMVSSNDASASKVYRQ